MLRDWPLIATMDEEHAPDCIAHEEEATAAADRRAMVIALPGELGRRLITTLAYATITISGEGNQPERP
jgi:hypothetical protein